MKPNKTEYAEPFIFEEQVQLPEMEAMDAITRHALAIAISMMQEKGEGHVGATTSAIHLMAAIYFHRHLERIRNSGATPSLAVCESHKPHAIPGWHALLYLEGILSREQMRQYRTFGGPNAYPTHLEPGIQIPTGSLGLGPSAAVGLAYLNQYIDDHFQSPPPARTNLQISIIGDSEFDEGILGESLKERATHGVKGWVDIIDYNRQSLDGNLDENLVSRISEAYIANGHRVLILKYGSKLRRLFGKSGGTRLRTRIDSLATADYHALLRLDGCQTRKVLCLDEGLFERYLLAPTSQDISLVKFLDSSPQDPQLVELLSPLSDAEVKDVLANLGGHDLSMLLAALGEAQRLGGGLAIIAYTVKGWGVGSMIGSLSGHWQKPTPDELLALQESVAPGIKSIWDRPAPTTPEGQLLHQIEAARKQPKVPGSTIPFDAATYQGPEISPTENVSTQAMAGLQLTWLCSLPKGHPLMPLVDRIVTMSADVAFSAGLKNWLNSRRVWGLKTISKIPYRSGASAEMNTEPDPTGQHIRLSNVEQFMGILNASFGKSGDLTRHTLFPMAFFYDIFLERFIEMFKYAAFWDARCWFVGTISGLTSPAESGLHHSVLSGVVGNATPNVVMWEPAFPQEVNWIFAEEFRRATTGEDQGRRVRYLRASAIPMSGSLLLKQLRKGTPAGVTDSALLDTARKGCLAGGYRLLDSTKNNPDAQPGKNVVTLVTSGLMVPEVIQAAELLESRGIFANIVCVSSAKLLEESLRSDAENPVFPETEREKSVPILTITDSHPSCLAGIVSCLARQKTPPRFASLGVTRFDRSGTREQLLSWHELDALSIAKSAEAIL